LDGVVVVDKPAGLTSHDVVAAARRILGERRIGHTGTLDPIATGVLPLACGRATRLARFFSAADKEYEATILFGVTTDSYDVAGRETGRSGTVPDEAALREQLTGLVGAHLQTPPAFSAKKVAGRRAYDLARAEQAPALAPVPVRLHQVELTAFPAPRATVALTCSSGFYVRSFVHTLGERLGSGACLEALRRTRSGEFRIADAVTLERLAAGNAALVPLSALLPGLPAVTVTVEGRERVAHGRSVGPDCLSQPPGPAAEWIRLLDERGALVGLATPENGTSLHPEVVLI
jgi:tRNA pseudouridine55 synthase